MYNAKTLRVHYSSLATPSFIFDIDLDTFDFGLKKIQEIPSGFNPDHYVVERHMVESHDGVKIPISLVYLKGLKSQPHYCFTATERIGLACPSVLHLIDFHLLIAA